MSYTKEGGGVIPFLPYCCEADSGVAQEFGDTVRGHTSNLRGNNMFPNVFLNTLWRLETQPQVFVAMPFGKDYEHRFSDVIAPAIRSIERDGTCLEPFRVDLARSGDDVLTEAMKAIAHCELFLADVSTTGKDTSGACYRNGNVMYEVGLALACRQPEEVLLIRNDSDSFLFDISTIPHIIVDYGQPHRALSAIRNSLQARLKERDYIDDTRVQLALARLGTDHLEALEWIESKLEVRPDGIMEPTLRYYHGCKEDSKEIFRLMLSETSRATAKLVAPLLTAQLVAFAGFFESGEPAFRLTPFGQAVARRIKSRFHRVQHSPDLATVLNQRPTLRTQ
jgi:hypothetical protein